MTLTAEQIALLIDDHAGPLELWVSRRCDAAEDVVQEAFCRLATADPPPDRPAAWLFRVARNLAESHRRSSGRRRKREQRVALREEIINDPADRLAAEEIIEAVDQLDDKLREIVIARIWGQFTFDEIADLCDVSTATASRHFREALAELRSLMGVPCPAR